jgi:hypothetical protein
MNFEVKKMFYKVVATVLCFSMFLSNVQPAVAKVNKKAQKSQALDLSLYVKQMDKISEDFNTSGVEDKKRVERLLSSYESFLGRKLSASESKFLALEMASVPFLPRFELKDQMIHVYQQDKSKKDLLLTIEVVDAEKKLFKFGGKTFELKEDKSIHENVQIILHELENQSDVSFWNKMREFFSVPQAHAQMAPWLKYTLIAGAALVLGIVIGKSIQKKKAKKELENRMVAEHFDSVSQTYASEAPSHDGSSTSLVSSSGSVTDATVGSDNTQSTGNDLSVNIDSLETNTTVSTETYIPEFNNDMPTEELQVI